MGGALGAIAGHFIPSNVSTGYWALIGMAAMMGGTMRSPLTATLFAVELTGNSSALLPLLVGCTTAHAVTVLMLKRSILTEKVARRGYHIMREYSVDPLTLARVSDVMVTNVDTLSASTLVAEALQMFTDEFTTAHTGYPIVDSNNKILGMVSRKEIFRWSSDPGMASKQLGNITSPADVILAYPDELVSALVERMMITDAGRVPVISREDNRLVGLGARKDLLKIRAKALAEEQDRQVFLGPRAQPV